MEPEAAVHERSEEAIGGRDERMLAQLAIQHAGLTHQQIERIIAALERRGGLISELRELTPEQRVVVDGFRNTAQTMGIRGLQAGPPRVVRKGRVVAVEPPAGSVRARIFLESSVVTQDVERGADRICLPDCIRDHDRIARIEFLDERDAVLGVTGGEVPRKATEGSGQCSTY